MKSCREKTKHDKDQFLHSLKDYLSGLNEACCFFSYAFHISFLYERLVILLTQQKTGVALQIHVVIDDNGRGVVEHFTLYEDPSLVRISGNLAEAALIGTILQGLNILFFLATHQQLSSLPFYLWHEEAEYLMAVESFVKEKIPVGNYVRCRMPTKTKDYEFFITTAQKIFMRLHDKLWRLRNNDKQVTLFLQTKGFFKKYDKK
jgi:hypothetical protein